MALVDIATSRCAICTGKLTRSFVATSGIAFPRSHRLFAFCDAPLHLDCLERWPDRLEFSAGYFSAGRTMFESAGALLHEEATWLLGCGIIGGRVTYVEVRMKEWPLRFIAAREHWVEYWQGKFAERLSGEALAAAQRIAAPVLVASAKLGLVFYPSSGHDDAAT